MFRSALILGALALSGGALADTSEQIFVGVGSGDAHYALSVVDVDSCITTYGLTCTAGSVEALSKSVPCEPSETRYVTVAPSSWAISRTVSASGALATFTEACQFTGTTKAVCSASISTSYSGSSTAVQSTTTLSASDIIFQNIPVTAGASKLSAAASSCTASGNAAAPTPAVDVYKVLVLPAAVMLAGAIL